MHSRASQTIRQRGDRIAVALGAAALGLGMVSSIMLPPAWWSVVLGAIAVFGLSRDMRLGVLPAALVVLIAVPYGRAADIELAEVVGIPLHFQDGVLAAAAVASVPVLRRIDVRAVIARLIILFLVVGSAALVLGALEGNGARDILRDARWWILYGFGLVALWDGVDRARILRGFLIGACLFAAVVVTTALTPVFEGGLKDRALTYDYGNLRLEFTNSAFLLPALAYFGFHFICLVRPMHGVWLAVITAAVFLSVTRVSILVAMGVLGLTVGWALWRYRGELVVRDMWLRAAAMALMVGVTFTGAILILTSGQLPSEAEQPVARILFQDPESNLDAIDRGRFQTYRNALDVIRESPLIGSGLGTLVPFGFTPGGAEPSTPGMQPGVDDAYLTVAMKAGLVGAAAFAALILWPLAVSARHARDRFRWWLLPSWIGILAVTLTQSFASSGYGPFGLSILIVTVAGLQPSGARRIQGLRRREPHSDSE